MDIRELAQKIGVIGDIYARLFHVERSDDWYLIKLQEEVGELCAAFLKLSGRTRAAAQTNAADQNPAQDREALAAEVADVLAHTILFANAQGIDIQKALDKKWLHYLDQPLATPASEP